MAAVGLLAVIAVVWFVFFRPNALGGSTGYIVVEGSSMVPTLHNGDLVIVRARDSYDVGDIIAFEVPEGSGPEELVIHRVVGGSSTDGYVTRGDNRTTIDPWRTAHDDVVGSSIARIPRLGTVAGWIASPFPIGLLVGAVLASMYWLYRDAVRERPSVPHHIASSAEIVAGRIHRRYDEATTTDERIRLRQLAFETAGVIAREHDDFDPAEFLRMCGTFAYDGADAAPRSASHHQR